MRNQTILLTVLLTSMPVCGHAADKVYPKNGVPASGKITSISPSRVVISVRGKDQGYEIADVQKVAFDGEPAELERARDQFVNGQYDQALDEIKKIDPSSAANEVIRQEIVFYRWYCEGKQGLVGQGDIRKAIQELEALAAANRKTHHLIDIFAILGELNQSIGNLDEAVKYLNFLTRAPDPMIKLQGQYQLAMVDLSREATAAAREKLDQVIAQKSNSPEMARIQELARIGLARCAYQEGKHQEALEQLDDLAKRLDNSDHDLFGRIDNARGHCYKAMGNPVAALLSFLQTDLLFFTAPEPHAEALYELQDLWAQYGEPAKAAEAKKRLATQYASSTWANKP